jgi:hypothetical protein
MTTIFDLLKMIEQRPGMFVGGDDGQRELQLRNLEMFLLGYANALHQHRIDEPGKGFLEKFGAYLRERFDWSASAGPIAAVLSETGSPDEAWRTFWRLVWEYRDSVQKN